MRFFASSVLFALINLLVLVASQTTNRSATTTTPAPITNSTSIRANATSTTPNATSTLPPGESIIQVTIQVFTSTLGLEPTPTSVNSTLNSTSTKFLDTKIDATFGVLGAVLIGTGFPMTFLGGRNRWSSYFLTGFYAGSLVTMVLIFRFGVEKEVNEPSESTKGLFLFGCLAAGIVVGAMSILFYKGTRLLIGLFGGFFLGMWIMTLRDSSVIRAIGFRYLFMIALSALGFIANTIPNFLLPTTIVSTSIVGATSLVLGVDCFTTANLKEFYVYVLGFGAILPPKVQHNFPVSSSMMIELGVIAALTLMGIASQLKLWSIMEQKVKEIKKKEVEREEEEKQAGLRIQSIRNEDLANWEEKHGSSGVMENLGFKRPKLNDRERRASSTLSLLGSSAPPYPKTPDTIGKDLEGFRTNSLGTPMETPQLSLKNIETDPTLGIDGHPEIIAKKKELEEIAKLRQSIATLRGELKVSETSADMDIVVKNLTNSGSTSQPITRPQSAFAFSNSNEKDDSVSRPLSLMGLGGGKGAQRSTSFATGGVKAWEEYLKEREMIYSKPNTEVKAKEVPDSSSRSRTPDPNMRSNSNAKFGNSRPSSMALDQQIEQPQSRHGRHKSSSGVLDRPAKPNPTHRASQFSMSSIPTNWMSNPNDSKRNSRVLLGDMATHLAQEREGAQEAVEQRVMNVSDLQKRHKEAIKKLQNPITSSFPKEEERKKLKAEEERMKAQVLAKQKQDAELALERERRRRSTQRLEVRNVSAAENGNQDSWLNY